MYIYIYMVPPPKDLPFLTYLFNILWFGMIIKQLIERGTIYIYIHIHMYIYIYVYINTYTYTQAYALNQQNVANTYRRTHADTSQKIANFANFPGSINKRYVRGIVVCSRSIKWYLKGI